MLALRNRGPLPHPSGNGQCERFNSTLLSMLGTLSDEQKVNWKSYVAPLVHAYNATVHESTGYSPHFLMFGWHPRLPIDAFLGVNSEIGSSKSHESYAKQLERRLQFAYKTAAKSAEKASRRHKTRYDLRVRNSVLKSGDRVLLKNIHIRGKQKLANRWNREPFVVVSQPDTTIPVYVIRPEFGDRKSKTVHRNLLLPIYSLPFDEISHQNERAKQVGKRGKISDVRDTDSSSESLQPERIQRDHEFVDSVESDSDSDTELLACIKPRSVNSQLNLLASDLTPLSSILPGGTFGSTKSVDFDQDSSVDNRVLFSESSQPDVQGESLSILPHEQSLSEISDHEVSDIDSKIHVTEKSQDVGSVFNQKEQSNRQVLRRTTRQTRMPNRYGDYLYF